MIQKINPLLKPENRKEFIKQAIKAMTERQNEVIKQADKIIDDVAIFEKNIYQQFASHTE